MCLGRVGSAERVWEGCISWCFCVVLIPYVCMEFCSVSDASQNNYFIWSLLQPCKRLITPYRQTYKEALMTQQKLRLLPPERMDALSKAPQLGPGL